MADIIRQSAAVLNELVAQAQGTRPLAVVDTTSFLAVAKTVLDAGVDMVTGKIDNLLSRTLFSTRPYQRKLVSMHRSNEEFGAYTRRFHVEDGEAHDSPVYADTSAAGVDMYRAATPKIAATYIAGGGVHKRELKIYDHQFNTAFEGPSQLLGFFNMLQSNFTDIIEQEHEQESRATLGTFIAGKITLGGKHVVYLLDEYNAATGMALTPVTVRHPDNFGDFIKWMYARINIASDLMTERSGLFHSKPGINTMRHTPKSMQHMYMHSAFARNIGSRVMGDVYKPEALQIPTAEVVNYWQGIEEPERLIFTPRYMDDTGAERTGPVVDRTDVVAVLCDKDCMGLTTIDQAVYSTPINAAARYWVKHAHFTDRTYTDYTAQGIVFALTANP